jgi:hypothetical protein
MNLQDELLVGEVHIEPQNHADVGAAEAALGSRHDIAAESYCC